MSTRDFSQNLQSLAKGPDFAEQSEALIASWIASKVGVEAVEPILRFMEDHPDIEYGLPGALVHFAERFYELGYEPLLIASMQRKPTLQTVWMLNRLINGTGSTETRDAYIQALKNAEAHKQLDEATALRITHFLEKLAPATLN